MKHHCWVFAMSMLCAAAPAWGQATEEPGEAPADDEQAARESFDRAVELTKENRWKEACPHFERSHELRPTGGTRLRLADCYEHTDRLIEARVLYREIIASAASETVPERVIIARERLSKIDRLLEQKGKAPTPPAPPTTTKPPAPPDPEPQPTDEGLSPIPGAVLLAVGGAGLVVGAILGGLALGQEKSVRDSCTNGVCPIEKENGADAAKAKALGADICFGIGGAVAITGLVLLILSVTGSSSDEVSATPEGMVVRF